MWRHCSMAETCTAPSKFTGVLWIKRSGNPAHVWQLLQWAHTLQLYHKETWFFLLLICPEILGKHRKSVSIQCGRGNLGCWRFWGTKNTNKCALKYHSNQLFFYPERHNAFTKRWECTTLWSVMLDLTEEKQSIANRDKMHQCYWEHS